MTRKRIILIMLALLGAGVSQTEIVQTLVDAGEDRSEVRAIGRKLKGRLNRDPKSLREGRVFLLVRSADVPDANAAVVKGMCADVGNAKCLTTWGDSLSQKYCRVDTGKAVALGAQWSVTLDQFEALKAAMVGTPRVLAMRRATRQKVSAALAGLSVPLKRCIQPLL